MNNFDNSLVEKLRNVSTHIDVIVDDYIDGYFNDDIFMVTNMTTNTNMIFLNESIKTESIFNLNKYKIAYGGYFKVYPIIKGGLGNQLYIIAAAVQFSQKYNYKLINNQTMIRELHKWEGEIDINYSILDHCDELRAFFITEDVPDKAKKFNWEEYDNTHITPLWPHQIIEGYFQNISFFSEFDIRSVMQNFIKMNEPAPEISIHLCRGDYTKNMHIFPITEIDYIEEVSLLLPAGNITIIGEDIEWFKPQIMKYFDGRQVYFKYSRMIDDFKALANTTTALAVGPSTFSWWAAYLNTFVKQIYCPYRFLSKHMDISKSLNYHIPGWNIIKDHNKILTDTRNMRLNSQWSELDKYIDDLNLIHNIRNSHLLHTLLDEYYMANFYLGNLEKAYNILCLYKNTYINDHIISNGDHILNYVSKNKTIVATYNPKRIPKKNELIII